MTIHANDWQVHDRHGRRKYLNGTERGLFLSAADRHDPSTRALCYVLAFTGCRVSEALALTHDHLDTELLKLRFRTLKRRRTVYRFIPVPPVVVELLSALPMVQDGHFWPMHRGTAWRHIRAVMDDAGITGPMACCRGLRHAYGIQAVTKGVPPTVLQRLLGHADIATTLIYVDAVGIEERGLVERMWS